MTPNIDEIIDRLNDVMEQSPEGESCPVLTRDAAHAILAKAFAAASAQIAELVNVQTAAKDFVDNMENKYVYGGGYVRNDGCYLALKKAVGDAVMKPTT